LFHNALSFEKTLKLIQIFKFIEVKKAEDRNAMPFLAHASFYILLFIKKYKEKFPQEDTPHLYNKAVDFIKNVIILEEKARL